MKYKGTITLAEMRQLWNALADAPPPTHLHMKNEKGIWRTYKVGSRRVKQILKFYARSPEILPEVPPSV